MDAETNFAKYVDYFFLVVGAMFSTWRSQKPLHKQKDPIIKTLDTRMSFDPNTRDSDLNSTSWTVSLLCSIRGNQDRTKMTVDKVVIR